MMPEAYAFSEFFSSAHYAGKPYEGLPRPHVIDDWKKRKKEKRPTLPAQLPLELPLPEYELPRPDDAKKKDGGDRGVVIIDLIGGSLDDFCK